MRPSVFLHSAPLPPLPALPCPAHVCQGRNPWLLLTYLSHSDVQRSLEGSHTCICQCSGNKYHHCDRGQRHRSLAFLETEDTHQSQASEMSTSPSPMKVFLGGRHVVVRACATGFWLAQPYLRACPSPPTPALGPHQSHSVSQ